MRSLRNQTLFLALVVAAAAVAVGCGGGGASGSSSGDAATASGSTGSSSSAEFTTNSSSSAGRPVETEVRTEDPVSEGAAAVEIKPRQAALLKDNDEVSPTGAKPIRPCRLVTRKEARAILGKRTKVAERPQGPTCVYTNAGRTVTLAVEVSSVKRLRHAARKARRIHVGHRIGWCIKYQSTAVIVGIGGGRVLRANGPCQAGVRFAAKALRRL